MVDDRKSRLAALAARAGRNKDNDNDNDDDIEGSGPISTHDENTSKLLKFRNYTPKDANLETSISMPDETEDVETTRIRKRSKTDDKKLSSSSSPAAPQQSELEKALLDAKADAALTLQQQKGDNGGTSAEISSVAAIAPKKVNWDLKRDIAKKIKKLERRTQRAIVDLLRERLEKEAEEETNQDDDTNDLD